jgi:hypothetical protein
MRHVYLGIGNWIGVEAMTKDEALDLALEALESVQWMEQDAQFARKIHKSITAIKQARSAPVQEPVGEVNRYGLDSHGRKWHGIHWYDPNVDVAHGTKLYTTPPAAQRQWVGLTTAGVEEIALNHVTEVSECCKAIREAEAKLRKENT